MVSGPFALSTSTPHLKDKPVNLSYIATLMVAAVTWSLSVTVYAQGEPPTRRITFTETPANSAKVAEAEKQLQQAGIDVRLSVVHNKGQSVVLREPTGSLLLEVYTIGTGETVDQLLARLTPERVKFEISARKKEFRPINEEVAGTRIRIAAYELALMKRMSVTYHNGSLTYGGKSYSLTVDDAGVPNEEVVFGSLELKDTLFFCVKEIVKEGKGILRLLYFLTREGTRFTVSEGKDAQIERYCSR